MGISISFGLNLLLLSIVTNVYLISVTVNTITTLGKGNPQAGGVCYPTPPEWLESPPTWVLNPPPWIQTPPAWYHISSSNAIYNNFTVVDGSATTIQFPAIIIHCVGSTSGIQSPPPPAQPQTPSADSESTIESSAQINKFPSKAVSDGIVAPRKETEVKPHNSQLRDGQMGRDRSNRRGRVGRVGRRSTTEDADGDWSGGWGDGVAVGGNASHDAGGDGSSGEGGQGDAGEAEDGSERQAKRWVGRRV